MSFAQGVSGINAAAQALDVIGNNISNSQTIGFKSSSTSFSDMFSGSMIGLGVQLAGVTKNFADGSLIARSNNLDMAILGHGFFRLTDERGGVYYSRNGEFKFNADRQIVNLQNKLLTGYQATGTPPAIQPGSPMGNIMLPDTAMVASASTKGSIKGNLQSNAKPPKVTLFDINKTDTYNFTSQLEAYDSLGNKHIIKVFYVKNETEDEWKIHSYDETMPVLDSDKKIKTESVTVHFDENGRLKKEGIDYPKLSIAGLSFNGATPLKFDITLEGLTQQGPESQMGEQKTDGYGVGNFTDYTISDKGEIIASYSNGQTQLVAQVVMANFTNPGDLQPTGDNCWSETYASGTSIIGISGSSNFGRIAGKRLEASNVDMSNELVKMMTQQRNYQSNAQTIKTQDQLLQTLVSMR